MTLLSAWQAPARIEHSIAGAAAPRPGY